MTQGNFATLYTIHILLTILTIVHKYKLTIIYHSLVHIRKCRYALRQKKSVLFLFS